MKSRHAFEIRILGMLIAGALGGSVLAVPVFAQSYTAFDIGTLGGPGTYAAAINASGQITGNSDTANGGPNHAFVTLANGLGITDLGTLPGGNKSLGFGINASGQVTGESEFYNGGAISPRAFIADVNGGMRGVTQWSFSRGAGINDNGQVAGSISNISHSGTGAFVTGPGGVNATEIGSLHSSRDAATGINTSGQVVGYAYLSASGLYEHAYITSANHTFASDLGTLGGSRSYATSINDSGQVAGFSEIRTGFESPMHAFITDIDSNMTDLGTLGGQNSRAFDINSNGQVVGWAETDIANRRHAFITGPDGTGMTDLNSLIKLGNGIFLADATGINDKGQIIANASDGHAYLISPIPEPETYAMFLAGLGLMSYIVRRRTAV